MFTKTVDDIAQAILGDDPMIGTFQAGKYAYVLTQNDREGFVLYTLLPFGDQETDAPTFVFPNEREWAYYITLLDETTISDKDPLVLYKKLREHDKDAGELLWHHIAAYMGRRAAREDLAVEDGREHVKRMTIATEINGLDGTLTITGDSRAIKQIEELIISRGVKA